MFVKLGQLKDVSETQAVRRRNQGVGPCRQKHNEVDAMVRDGPTSKKIRSRFE